jgi:hypothetical protein
MRGQLRANRRLTSEIGKTGSVPGTIACGVW